MAVWMSRRHRRRRHSPPDFIRRQCRQTNRQSDDAAARCVCAAFVRRVCVHTSIAFDDIAPHYGFGL